MKIKEANKIIKKYIGKTFSDFTEDVPDELIRAEGYLEAHKKAQGLIEAGEIMKQSILTIAKRHGFGYVNNDWDVALAKYKEKA